MQPICTPTRCLKAALSHEPWFLFLRVALMIWRDDTGGIQMGRVTWRLFWSLLSTMVNDNRQSIARELIRRSKGFADEAARRIIGGARSSLG